MQLQVGNEEELHLNGVVATSGGTIFLVSEWGIVFRCESDGESWEIVETGYDGSFFGVVVNTLTDSVFAYGLLGTVYRSTDQGRTWEEMQSNASTSLFGVLLPQRAPWFLSGSAAQR